MNTCFRLAVLEDLPELLQLEEQCFTTDRLNSRSFQWMITRAHGQLLVAQAGEHWLGYAVVLFHRGTSLARGVRDEHKKDVMRLVHEAFTQQLLASDVEREIGGPLKLPQLLEQGGQPLVLISSYRLTRSKSPHWVIVTDCDDEFVYLHDPDVDHSQHRQAMDCQHVPVSHGEFDKMCSFGRGKLRAAVIVYSR